MTAGLHALCINSQGVNVQCPREPPTAIAVETSARAINQAYLFFFRRESSEIGYDRLRYG